MAERRFTTTFREEQSDEPGLVLTDADAIEVVAADGSRSALGAGGGESSAATARMSVGAGALTNGAVVPFDTALADEDGYLNPVAHTLTVPAGKGGLFLVGLSFAANDPADATYIACVISNSGDDINPGSSGVIGPSSVSVTALLQLADGDVLTPRVLHDATSPIGLGTSGGNFWLKKES